MPWASTLNLDVQLTRSVCTPGNQLNKLLCFVSTIVRSTTTRITPIAPARQHIQSTCTGGNASIVSYPPADAAPEHGGSSILRNVCNVMLDVPFALRNYYVCNGLPVYTASYPARLDYLINEILRVNFKKLKLWMRVSCKTIAPSTVLNTPLECSVWWQEHWPCVGHSRGKKERWKTT